MFLQFTRRGQTYMAYDHNRPITGLLTVRNENKSSQQACLLSIIELSHMCALYLITITRRGQTYMANDHNSPITGLFTVRNENKSSQQAYLHYCKYKNTIKL